MGTAFLQTAPTVSVTVGVASAELIATNDRREYFLIVNLGVNDVYIAFGETATIAGSIKLPAGIGFYESSRPDLFQGQVNAIADSGSSDVRVTEGV